MHSTITFSNEAYFALNNFLKTANYSSVFVLTDSNTRKFCLPVFAKKVSFSFKILEIPTGENHKNIETAIGLWQELTNNGADRKSLLINLGGGVITDIGGFVAATFKRGIDFVNIPTSLLAMVDAAIGGKTGIDLGVLKNQVGLFAPAKEVLIDADYLESLSYRELRSGMAEVIKYGLSYDRSIWVKVSKNKHFTISDISSLIAKSASLKNSIVKQDPKEEHLRKVLNFGHTLGHAVESYFLNHAEHENLTHGEAIAIGMILESFLSISVCGLSISTCDEIKNYLLSVYDKVSINSEEIPAILDYLKHDKKNIGSKVLFVLIPEIGKYAINQEVTQQAILDAFAYYDN